jgi:hypothetical protein
MKWLPLKMNYLPLIFQEINIVTEEYITILSKLREKEKENQKNINKNEISPNKNDQSQSKSESENENNYKEKGSTEDDEYKFIIKKYNHFRESICKRINELENFYEENLEDIRIAHFEKARLRLKKLLMYSYENINKIENSSQQKDIFIKDTTNLYNKIITEETKRKILENNISLEKKLINERNKEEEKVRKKLIGNEQNKAGNKIDTKLNLKKIIKVRGDEGFLRPTDRSRKGAGMREYENIDKRNFDDYSKFKEIVFKIKLSQDEFKLLLKEKKNKGGLSPNLFK